MLEYDEDRIICRTAADLIEALSAMPPDTRLYTHEPPFTGVLVVPNPEGHKAGIHSLWSTAEGREQRAVEKAEMAARRNAA
jgi:hypothetical protein